ncbi:MAG: PA0069 family radical SAM protein [Pseudomonadota bacterium]
MARETPQALFDQTLPAVPEPQPARRRGRAAATNPTGRYERFETVPLADDWPGDTDPEAAAGAARSAVRTQVSIDASRSVLTRNTSPDVPFDRSVNPYRGCEHGCIYCFARPSHAQLGLSPGLDFETRLLVKPRAPALLAAALRKRGYTPQPIAIGTNTDPYQPIERDHRIMRGVLGVLEAFNHPVCITTKGAAVTDDIDLLARMGRRGLAQVTLSLTTLDSRLSRAMEPRAAAPARRLAAIRALARAGVPVQVNIAPIVPGLTDHELETLLAAAAEAGAKAAHYTVLRLPLEVADLFKDWLARDRPDAAAKVMGRVREMHGGRDYDPAWGRRLKGQGVHAQLIARRFALACTRHGLAERLAPLRTDLFAVPIAPGDQLTLDL